MMKSKRQVDGPFFHSALPKYRLPVRTVADWACRASELGTRCLTYRHVQYWHPVMDRLAFDSLCPNTNPNLKGLAETHSLGQRPLGEGGFCTVVSCLAELNN
jgi:hypothetical protein